MTNRTHQVILHVSDKAEDVPRAVAAAETLTQNNSELDVRIIVNGTALNGVTDSAEQVSPGEATTIEACELGMQRRNLPLETLQSNVPTVPSSILAIVEAQLAGAAYVRI
ncbi:MAG: hypothetical protein WED09_12950 [Homoserinimonas sp.]